MAYTPENNPYVPGDPYSYDLKWIVSNIKDLIANYTGQIDELKAFIMDYINSLDLSPIVAAQLQEMYDNGDFDAIIASFITDNKVLLVDTDQSAIFTEAEKETGRKNLRAGSTNPNLLDNPWFTVNQRGLSSYTGNVITLDRWEQYKLVTTVNADGSITIAPNESGLSPVFYNKIPGLALAGKVVTFSMLNADDTITTWTDTMPSADGMVTSGILSNGARASLVKSGGNNQISIYPYNSVRTLKAVKLELGTVSTLANDAPPDYTEELAKCQRYFFRLNATAANAPIGMAIGLTANAGHLFIPTPVPMRKVTPTVISNTIGSFHLIGDSDTTLVSISSLGADTIQDNGVTLNFTAGAGTITNYKIYALTTQVGTGYIDISTDL